MFTPVPGTLASPPITGLVASAARVEDDWWEDGFSWVPERCGTSYQLVLWCSGDDPADYDTPRAEGVYYRPVGVRWADECTTLGGVLDVERLRRIAEATTPFVIARELWTAEIGQDDSWTTGSGTYSNPYLASAEADVVGSGGAALLRALTALEQAAVEATRGQRVMLHLPIVASGSLGEYVRRVGPDLLTRQDNLVVVDAGYPGTGPAGQSVGSTAWAYATTPVQVRWSELQIVSDPGQTVSRSSNSVTVWAERVFAATFDPCAHFATEITL
jgi:hypothetical protein